MTMPLQKLRPMVFPIQFAEDDVREYVVPPVGDEAGMALAAIISNEGASKSKMTSLDAMKLAMTPELWQRMRDDGVPFHYLYLIGTACLAHFQVIMLRPIGAPGVADEAEAAARTIMEAGISPESVAAYQAAQNPAAGTASTKRSTRSGAASSTRNTTSGTTTRRTPKKNTPSRSRGRGSSTSTG